MLTYKDAGVDIDAGESLIHFIKHLTPKDPRVQTGVGPFAAVYDFAKLAYRDPLLVTSTDGVGTKIKLALQMDRLDTIGIDLVAMSVNDIITTGARPIFFLDYYATGKLDPPRAKMILKGIVTGCGSAGCALIGGETAEHPGCYTGDLFDLAGFAVGLVERNRIITGESVTLGDAIIGIRSTGVHANGFSLIHHALFEKAGLRINSQLTAEETLGDALLTPTQIYTDLVQTMLARCHPHGIAHITGNGIPGNLNRVIPKGLSAHITAPYPIPKIFDFIASVGKISPDEMSRVFNMGVGLVVIADKTDQATIIQSAQDTGHTAFYLGEITKDTGDRRTSFPYIIPGER